MEILSEQPIREVCFPTWPHYCFPLPCLVDLQIKLIAFHDVSQATLLEINSISHASQMLRYAEFPPPQGVSMQLCFISHLLPLPKYRQAQSTIESLHGKQQDR